MSRGDKSSYTEKQKRQARHIEAGYIEQGVSEDEASARAWATVNKQDGGGKKSGSGRARSPAHDALKRRRSAQRSRATDKTSDPPVSGAGKPGRSRAPNAR